MVASSLDDQRLLIERGKTALARRDFASVADAVGAYRSRYHDGAFVEECDALEVLALVRGRSSLAAAATAAFAKRHPHSVFAGVIESAVAAERSPR